MYFNIFLIVFQIKVTGASNSLIGGSLEITFTILYSFTKFTSKKNLFYLQFIPIKLLIKICLFLEIIS